MCERRNDIFSARLHPPHPLANVPWPDDLRESSKLRRLQWLEILSKVSATSEAESFCLWGPGPVRVAGSPPFIMRGRLPELHQARN